MERTPCPPWCWTDHKTPITHDDGSALTLPNGEPIRRVTHLSKPVMTAELGAVFAFSPARLAQVACAADGEDSAAASCVVTCLDGASVDWTLVQARALAAALERAGRRDTATVVRRTITLIEHEPVLELHGLASDPDTPDLSEECAACGTSWPCESAHAADLVEYYRLLHPEPAAVSTTEEAPF